MPGKQREHSVSGGSAGQTSQPSVYVLAGANGAGKTTFAAEFLPDFVRCREFLNADLIAAGLSPFAPETQNVRAGRLLLARIRELTEARQEFGFETTLAGRGYVRQFQQMRDYGYRIVVFFLWLPSADMAVNRVANRMRQGGHSVPEPDIRRRYSAGIRNFFGIYQPLLDAWWLYDASEIPPHEIATRNHDEIELQDASLYRQITQDVKV